MQEIARRDRVTNSLSRYFLWKIAEWARRKRNRKEMISIQRCSGMEKYSISGCCLALVYEPVEAAPLCFVSSYVHPCCLADIIRITLFMLPFIRAVFRQREPPRLTAMRSGNNRGCNGRGQKETAPSTILTKQFKRLSRLFGALKNIQSGEEGSNNGSRLVV